MTTDTLTPVETTPADDPTFVAARDSQTASLVEAVGILAAAEADRMAAAIVETRCAVEVGRRLNSLKTTFTKAGLTKAAWVEHCETATGRKRAMLYRYAQAATVADGIASPELRTAVEGFSDVESITMLNRVPKRSLRGFVEGLSDTSRSTVRKAVDAKWPKPSNGSDETPDPVDGDETVNAENVGVKAAAIRETILQAVANVSDPFELLMLGAASVGGPLATITAQAIASIRDAQNETE